MCKDALEGTMILRTPLSQYGGESILSGKSSLRMHCTRCSVAVLTMLLLGGGTMADAASPGTAGIQDRQGAAQSTSLDEAERLNEEAVSLYRAGRYNEAMPLAKRILEIRENALGPDHPEVVQSLNNLALLYATTGDYARAEPLYQRALGIRENALGLDHPEVAAVVIGLLLHGKTFGFMEKKLTNSGRFREPADKHSIYPFRVMR